MLRLLLGYYLDTPPETLEFCTNPWGKPYLYQPSSQEKLHFNLSHSKDLALFGFSRYDVGVDLEHINSNLPFDSIATQVFSSPEIAVLSLAPSSLACRRFFDYWTGKEAYIKGIGRGLSIDVAQIDISAFGTQPIVISPDLAHVGIQPETWSLYPLNIATAYSAAVALKGSHQNFAFRSVVIETGRIDFRNWAVTKQALTEMLANAPPKRALDFVE